MTAKQPFSYCGGKQTIASWIIPYIPKHTTYVEPFAGGASVFWRKPVPENAKENECVEVLNDTNGMIANFYQQLRDNKEFLHKIKYTLYSEANFKLARKIKNDPNASKVDKAWAWFVVTNASFANDPFSSFGFSKSTRSTAAGFSEKAYSIKTFHERLKNVQIFNRDAIHLLKNMNAPWTFAYIDPPYPKTYQEAYGKHQYTEEDLAALVDFLDTEWKGSFILSCYDREIDKAWRKETKETRCYARNSLLETGNMKSRKRAEAIWIRGNVEPMPEKQIKILRRPKFNCFAGEVTDDGFIITKEQKTL